MTKRYPFSTDGRYEYGFTDRGVFTLLTKKGESLYAYAIPLCEKLGSHLLWVFFWLVLILVSNLFFSDRVVFMSGRVFMSLIFVHLFIFGCRLTTLLIKGGFRPVFFPPLWIRLTRQFQKGSGIELLKKHQLDTHPGLLVNLALTQLNREEPEKGHQTLVQALHHCPDHPEIQQIVTACASL